MSKFRNTEGYERYLLKGKTYYKVGEESVPESDKDIVSEIWNMKNTSGEDFRLFIRHQKTNTHYSLYNKTNLVFRTYGMSKVERRS